MKILKKFFPYSFKPLKKLADLIINALILALLGVVIGMVAGILVGVLSGIPLFGGILAWLLGIAAGLADLYLLIAILLLILNYLKVLK